MKIKILFMDVDGTLTDGGIYMGENGEVAKRFNAKDGYGINKILKAHGIIPAIITGRNSRIVENRCKELEIKDLIQGSRDKVVDCKTMLAKYRFLPGEAAYIGDDLNDLDVMKYVGVTGCPTDSVEEVKEYVDYVSALAGGQGAVRDFIEWIVKNEDL